MAQQTVNNGDSGLSARTKLNDNFTELYGLVNGEPYPRVANYAALPAASSFSGKIYIVENATGVWPFRRAAGMWLSNGTSWQWLGNALWVAEEIQFTPAGTISSINVQAAVEEVSGDVTSLTNALPETIDDRVAALLTAGSNIALTYNDPANTLTVAVTPALGTAAPLNVAASGNAAAGEVVKGNDTRLIGNSYPTPLTTRWYVPFIGVTLANTASAASTIRLLPFFLYKTTSVRALGTRIVTTFAGGVFALGIYASDANGLPNGAPVVNTGSLSSAVAGVVSGSVTTTSLNAGLYWLALSNGPSSTPSYSMVSQASVWSSAVIGGTSLAAVLPASPNWGGHALSIAGTTVGIWPTLNSGQSYTEVLAGPVAALQIS